MINGRRVSGRNVCFTTRRAENPSWQRRDRYDGVSECSSREEGPEGV